MAAEDTGFKASGKNFLSISKEHSQCSSQLHFGRRDWSSLVEKIRVSWWIPMRNRLAHRPKTTTSFATVDFSVV
jgi:hypothetical protein